MDTIPIAQANSHTTTTMLQLSIDARDMRRSIRYEVDMCISITLQEHHGAFERDFAGSQTKGAELAPFLGTSFC